MYIYIYIYTYTHTYTIYIYIYDSPYDHNLEHASPVSRLSEAGAGARTSAAPSRRGPYDSCNNYAIVMLAVTTG